MKGENSRARWKLLPLCLILLILAVEPEDPQGLCREKLGPRDSPSWLRSGGREWRTTGDYVRSPEELMGLYHLPWSLSGSHRRVGDSGFKRLLPYRVGF